MSTCLANRSKLNKFGSLNRKQSRNLIELYCEAAYLLPVHERILFLLYYRDGYSTIEISQLMMKSQSAVARRLKKISEKLTEICQADGKVRGEGKTLVTSPSYPTHDHT